MLLADDHGIVRRGLRSLLEEAGESVVVGGADLLVDGQPVEVK